MSKANLKVSLALSAFLIALVASVVSAQIIYVDESGPITGDGSTWLNAFRYLNDALDAASYGDEIWVAQGSYKPDDGSRFAFGDRDATFALKSGVAVYGGFPTGGADFDLSDPNRYETILTGDLDSNDGPDFSNNSDNCLHVVTGDGVDPNAILDGFTITAGNADGLWGGGMYNDAAWPIVAGCKFYANYATYGGGLGDTNGSSTMIINCTFIDNSADYGGGVYTYFSNAHSILINCVFTGNYALYKGGAVRNYTDSSVTVTNCTFADNTAGDQGGGLHSSDGTLTVTNSIVWGNIDGSGEGESAQIYISGGAANVTFSCIADDDSEDGYIPFGGADSNNIDDDPMFFSDLSGEVDVHLWFESPCIDAGNNDADTNAGTPELESLPVTDLDGRPRFINSPTVPDTGNADPSADPVIDMGAYEHGYVLSEPILFSEPNMTRGTDNEISWSTVADANEYYAQCGADPNFADIFADTGWIYRTSYEFTNLSVGQSYWYRVKARTVAENKTWLQTTLPDFAPDTFINTTATAEPNDVILAMDSVIDTIATDASAYIASAKTRLNVFECTAESTLTEIEIYLDIAVSTELRYVVYESDTKLGTYGQIHSNTVPSSATGEGFYNSGEISVLLEAGKYYAVGAAWQGLTTYYLDTLTAPAVSFGDCVGYAQANYPPPATVNLGQTTHCYYMRLTTASGTDFAPDGEIISTALVLPNDGDWGVINFNITAPIDTEITIDVLDGENDAVILTDVNSPTDISWTDANSIRLRANLSTTDPCATPVLHNWSISYIDPTRSSYSGWSNIESSMQSAPGDFDLNGVVGLADFAVFAAHWLESGCDDFGDESDWCYGTDIDENGTVEPDDLNTFLDYWLE